MFTAKGGKPQWQMYFELFAPCDYGDEITFEQIQRAGLDPIKSRSAIRKAENELLLNCQKAVVSIRGVGYRIAYPPEHSGIARAMRKSARRRLQRSVTVSVNANTTDMTVEQRRTLEQDAYMGQQVLAFMARTQAEVKQVKGDVRRVDDRLGALEASLRRQGLDVPEESKVVVGTVLNDANES